MDNSPLLLFFSRQRVNGGELEMNFRERVQNGCSGLDCDEEIDSEGNAALLEKSAKLHTTSHTKPTIATG